MVKKIQNILVQIWKGYSSVTGVALLVIAGALFYLFLTGDFKTKNLRNSIKVLSGQNITSESKEIEKVPEGKWADLMRESLNAKKRRIEKMGKRLDRRESTLEGRIVELENRERSLDKRAEKLAKKEKEFKKMKEKWIADLNDENFNQVVNAISSQASRRQNPENAIALLDQYINANKKDGETNYQLAYKVMKALEEEKRVMLINTLAQGDNEKLRDELLKRFGPIAREEQEETQ